MSERELAIGDYAPDFTAIIDGDGSDKVTLSDFRGKNNIVLYFYPKDSTPGCTKEANDFTKKLSEFEKHDAIIFGVSKDSVASHNKFKEKQQIGFNLISDEEGSICSAYGTYVEKSMFGKKYMGVQRDSFIIDKQGKIRKIYHKVKVEGHADDVLKNLESL